MPAAHSWSPQYQGKPQALSPSTAGEEQSEANGKGFLTKPAARRFNPPGMRIRGATEMSTRRATTTVPERKGPRKSSRKRKLHHSVGEEEDWAV
ncbi:unnamed protein product [Calypogeia fissa]